MKNQCEACHAPALAHIQCNMNGVGIDWSILERLRSRFLAAKAGTGAYWESETDLQHYHATFAARIGWKWDHALAVSAERGFRPKARRILDWGCGSGIASLRALAAWGESTIDEVALWDHSALACRFAEKELLTAHPRLRVRTATLDELEGGLSETIVLISHALNELNLEQRSALALQLRGAAQILIVEPGDSASSRILIELRERLLTDFEILAPCTRCGGCPMLEDENARHWCHFFAKPPIDAFTDGEWARFASTMQIDLRSLPYSFLAMQRNVESARDHDEINAPSRMIGRPKFFKGYARFLSCDPLGLRELELQQRDDKGLWKSLKKGRDGSLYRWRADKRNRVESGAPIRAEGEP